MPYLNEIVCLINRNFTSFNRGGKHGIAYQTTKRDGNTEQLFPTYLQDNEPKYIGIDDAKGSIIYHRIVGTTYRRDAGFNNLYTATVQMLMVVYGKGLGMRTENVEGLILSQFPDTYQGELIEDLSGVNSVRVQFTRSDLNPVTVFSGEYRNVPYRIAPEDVYFSVSYSLEIQFDKDCYNPCGYNSVPDTLCEFMEGASAEEIIGCMSTEQEEAVTEILCEVSVCEYDIYVDGVFVQSVTLTDCEDLTINLN